MIHLHLALVILGSILLLLLLIIRFKIHAFLALLIVTILTGIAAGMPLGEVIVALEKGMAGTLGFVAVVVGLGAMFGAILEASGGIERLADTLLNRFGEDKAQWAFGLLGFIVAIPVFFDVGFVILVPLVYGLSKRTSRSLLYYAIPLLAGLAVTHSFIPPTPGPVAVANILGAELGWVILFGAVCGLPAMILAGPLYGRWIAARIHAGVPDAYQMPEPGENRAMPGFATISLIVLIPLLLILANTVSVQVLDDGNPLREFLTFIGHPFSALIIANLLAAWILGVKRGLPMDKVREIMNRGLEPAGIIILITGAGGAFKQMLTATGIGDMLAEVMQSSGLPIVLLAFLIAALVRIAQGSATVAMITAAGIVAAIIGDAAVSAPMLALLTISIASGATVLSHVNDSGFWLVSRYLGLSEKDTLRSWTVMETIIALAGLTMALILSLFFN